MPLLDQFTWIPFKNVHATATVPPFGVMEVTGTTVNNEQPMLTVTQPTTNFQRFYMINGEVSIRAGFVGRGTFGPSCIARYDNAATPAFGQTWGAKPASWDLFPGRPGFDIHGIFTNEHVPTLNLVYARQMPVNVLKCKPAPSNITANSSGSADIYFQTTTGPTASDFDAITIWNRWPDNGQTLSSGKESIVRWFGEDDSGDGEWHVIERECE